MQEKSQKPKFDFGPDPRIEPPGLPGGNPSAFLEEHLVPLLSDDAGENVFAKKGEVILRDLWRRTHAYRPTGDQERRGRRPVRIPALKAIARGLEDKEHGRAGKPTQGDLERILAGRKPELDEDTRRKYARIYRLTELTKSEALSEKEWAWLAKYMPDHVHRCFFIFKTIRDAAKQRGFPETTNERTATACYVSICKALQRRGKPFTAPSYVEVIHFETGPPDK